MNVSIDTGPPCPEEHASETYEIVVETTMYEFAFGGVVMLSVLLVLIFKRGNFLATIVTAIYCCAFLIGALQFTSWIDVDNDAAEVSIFSSQPHIIIKFLNPSFTMSRSSI